MSDLISRQAAIEAFTDEIQVTGRANAKSVVKAYVKLVIDRIKRLPSAQPEKRTEERAETHACDLIERQAMNDDKMKIGDEVAFHWNDGRPDTVVVITHIGYDGFIDGMDAKGTLYASKNPQKWTKTGRYFPLVTHLLRQMSGDKLPSAQPTEASCWGCNCQKMERLKEQKTFSEMVHLHDAETHEERTRTHACDCISRQAAIDTVAEGLRNTFVEYRDVAEKMICKIPSAQHWIPCSERLPEKDEQVFVYLFDDSPYIAWFCGGRWHTEEFTLDKDEEPAAWMPLPEPYRAERRTDD